MTNKIDPILDIELNKKKDVRYNKRVSDALVELENAGNACECAQQA